MAEVIQGSPEWHAIRLGKVTASRVADVIAKTKSGPAASRKNYLTELVLERLTGERTEGFTNAAMQWGIDTEPQARLAYEFHRNVDVAQVGFVPHPSIADAGASPDGLVRDDGLVEIKCPMPATHMETLDTGAVPAKYVTQMQWQMACTGREFCDFVSFDPRFPAHMQFFCERVKRDDLLIKTLEAEVTDFLRELRDTVDRLKSKYEPTTDELPDAARFLMAG
jgi:putative phage-type endonuclease